MEMVGRFSLMERRVRDEEWSWLGTMVSENDITSHTTLGQLWC